MLRLKKVAVTGGLSSGKSTVCRIFRGLGAYVVSSDEIVHQLLSIDTNVGQQVIKLLGSDIIVDHKIDRSRIAKKVFTDPELLEALEKLLHPAVRDEIEKQYGQVKQNQAHPLFIAEIPLFFESGKLNSDYDDVIAVLAEEKNARKRFLENTAHDEKEFERRMSRQMSPEKKALMASSIIHNNGSLEDLRKAVTNLFNKLAIPSK